MTEALKHVRVVTEEASAESRELKRVYKRRRGAKVVEFYQRCGTRTEAAVVVPSPLLPPTNR